MSSIVIYCRSGFENDAAAEITYLAAEAEVAGYVKAKPDTGFVVYECFDPEMGKVLIKKLPFSNLVFARQWFFGRLVSKMPVDDRISAILEQVDDIPDECGELRVETPDTNEGKELSKFCKKFSTPLAKALEKKGKLTRQLMTNKPVIHALFIATDTAYVGFSFSNNNSPYPMGILRLKMPSDGPSRSTLKLDEAFHVFVPKDEYEKRVRSGMRAVDLGACPGGWTYQLVRRGMFVAAVDNGSMAESLMETGQVKHLREDGFKYRPERRNIDWLVCDMVEKPIRVANLMIDWLVNAFAKEAIFNLKLPMKKRFECVLECLTLIHDELEKYNVDYELQAKHLFHDREEITVHIRVNHVPQNIYS